jgi:Protein of unknown function (DUF992)
MGTPTSALLEKIPFRPGTAKQAVAPRRRMTRSFRIALTLVAAELFLGTSNVLAQNRVQAGTLACRIGPGVGAVIASHRQMRCRFNPRSGGRVEDYSGTITRFGLDVGVTAASAMTWVVFVRTRTFRSGALAGHYVGASADASLGAGAGAKALVGGSRRSTVLQPFSLVGQVGINLAVGITGLTLRYKGSSIAESSAS